MSAKAVENVLFILHLHVDLTHIIASTGYGLDQKFIQHNLPVDDLFHRIESRIHRTVPRCGGIEFLAGDIQPQGSRWHQGLASDHLEEIQFYPFFLTGGIPNQQRNIIIPDLLLAVGQFQAFAMSFMKGDTSACVPEER